MAQFTLRASSLTTHVDCGLRWASREIKEIREDCLQGRQGVEPKSLIGAVFGSANHAGAASLLMDKIEYGELRWQKALDVAVQYWTDALESTRVEVDRITRDKADGILQIEKTLGAWASGYALHAEPRLVELELECDVSTHVKLKGHPDVVLEDGWIDDHKFSHQLHPYQAQGGAYIILVSARYKDIKIPGMRLIHSRRVGLKSVQPDVAILPYTFDACVDAAWEEIEAIERELTAWYGDRKKKYWTFHPNPYSKFCTQKTCLAWGTDVCNQWRPEVEKENEEWVNW